MQRLIFVFALIFSMPAAAADKALILNDQEQAAMHRVFDVATKAGGLDIARITVYLDDKLQQAGTVTEQKPVPEPKKDQP